MRRTHWWGAAAGAGVLLGAVLAAPTALATGAPHGAGSAHPTVHKHVYTVKRAAHHPSKPVTRPGNQAGKPKPPKPPKPPRPPHCPYPANGTPSVALSGPSHSHVGRVVTFSATVSLNKCGRPGVSAALWGSKDNKNWKQLGTTTTGTDGRAAFSYLARSSTLFRVVVAGGEGAAPAQSEIHPLEVRPAKK